MMGKCGIRIFFAACLIFYIHNNAFAYKSDSGECTIPIDDFEILEDRTNNNSIFDIYTSPDFQHYTSINFGYTQSAYWVRFALHDLCVEHKQYLTVDFRCLDFINFYFISNGKIIDSLITGYLRPLDTREKFISHFVYRIPDNAKKTDSIYVKIAKKEGTLRTRLYIKDEITLLNNNNTERQIVFFFLGVSFLMMIFALGYYLYFRLPVYLWYALFILSFVMQQITNLGYGTMYLWGDWNWLSAVARPLWNVPATLALLKFSFHLLNVREFSPGFVSKAFRVLSIIMIIMLPLPFIPMSEYPWRISFFAFYIIIVCVIFIILVVAALSAIRRKHIPGYLFMAGEIILVLSYSIFALRNFDIISFAIPENINDFMHLYIGIFAMSLGLISMLSYTINKHINTVKEFVMMPKPEPKPLTEDELEKLNEVYAKLNFFLKEEKSFLNAALTLNMLSDKIEIPEHLLSKAINVKSEMHFFDFINSYRIEEAKKILSDNDLMKKYTIEALAGLCGFNNKNSFNKAFKKFTGETPTSYRQKR
jgi:AraC-like DNA-binding protein